MRLHGGICRFVFGLALLLFVGGTFSCSFDTVGSIIASLIPSVDYWNGETASWSYNGTEVQYEVPKNVRTLKLSVNGPVDIFMVKMNTSTSAIPASSTRYIVSAASDSNAGASYSSRSALEEASLLAMDDWENVSGISASGIIRKDFAPARDFVPPALGLDSSRSASGASYSVVGGPVKSVTQITPQVGKTTKKLWVDAKGDGNYTQESATLRAEGSHCYIWVLNDCFDDTNASGKKISSVKAQAIATKFEGMYTLIRDVFGEESDKMIDVQGRSEVVKDISNVSDTGKKVNIVVYDIGGDYKPGQSSGVLGYFWAKDYYSKAYATASRDSSIRLTNEGKYFYVDSGFLNSVEKMLYSTLAHEFQHMINFGQKTINHKVQSQTWSNEMMSMVCEDMIQRHLGIDELNSPIGRLLEFAKGYYLSGLTDWLSGNSVAYSYAGAYAFGAYLARNYGGTKLIKEIATNEYVDQKAITKALEAIGKNESFESVFKKYPQALVLDNPPKGVTAPSLNKSVQGIDGMMPAIDLFNKVASDGKGNTYSFKPTLLSANASNRVNLRPYGFTLHGVGYTESASTINLTFSSPVNEHEKLYILVQPRKSN